MVLVQYIPRFFVMFPLNRRIIKTTGVVAKTAWSGAAYNLLLYMLAGHVISYYICHFITNLFFAFLVACHCYLYGLKLSVQVIGASWYVLSIQRQFECWKIECTKEYNRTHSPSCKPSFLDCSTYGRPDRIAWLKVTRVITSCDARNDDDKNFQFGMFADAFTIEVASSAFFQKYFYCLWWGIKSLR